MQHFKPLTVLSASAGSGKTFSLVQTYLSLTIGGDFSPSNFSKILAMTFTNKAAWEMKERIVDALDRLAFPDRSNEKERAKCDQLMRTTQQNLGIDPMLISEKAKKILTFILHNYEAFQVLTIDKFSLRLIRTFAKDLDINDNFEVILNEDELIEKVVDELLSKLGAEEHQSLTKLAITYAKANLSEGNKWNFRKELIEFAKVLKSEKDQEIIQQILKQPFDDSLYDSLVAESNLLNQKYTEEKNVLLSLFHKLAIKSEDIPQGKNGLFGYLSKNLPVSELKKPKEIGKHAEKTLRGENINDKHRVPGELVPAVTHFLAIEKELFERYYIVNNFRKNFHNLSLLKYISNELNLIKERDNLVPISEFNRMISSLLVEEKAPYIYERLGTRFSHYLLDEFQDTSRLQWRNLLPLVHDAISQGAQNLIVGDPKQAIYRFRNGLVEQFVALPKIYNPEQDAKIAQLSNYFEEAGIKRSLSDNWRSQTNIVRFNNAFFSHLVTMLPDDYSDYYSDVVQNPKGKMGGSVSFDFVENQQEEQERFILSTIAACEEDGFNRGDICLLARNKREAKQWAKILAKSENKYKVVSADSLTVSSDKMVQVCLDYFYVRRNSKNKTIQIRFAVSYLMSKQEDPIAVLNNYWGKYVGDLKFDEFIQDYFDGKEAFLFHYENLYDLGRQLLLLLGYDELKNPYVHHLMEMLHQYDLRLGPDLRGFIDYWELSGGEETVQLPENDEAIQIMTIHKAKGLEFPVVILPDLNWKFNEVKSKQFLAVREEDMLYTKLVKSGAPDYILNKYSQERNHQVLDEVNLFYVAVTRAVNRLYGLVEYSTKTKLEEFSNINQFCYSVLQGIKVEGANLTESSFTLGEASPKEAQTKETENYFVPKNLKDCLWFPDLTLQDEDALEVESLSEEQRYGNQLHEILSRAKSENELEDEINRLLKLDSIEHGFLVRLKSEALTVLTNSSYKALFENVVEVLSEQDLICDTTMTKRPDLILIYPNSVTVVDFKTGEERNTHKKQVYNYVTILKEMGYSKIKGKLIYTSPFKLVDVI